MREERRRKRKRQQIITLLVCALVLAALIWGIVTVVRKLTNYGNRSIASSQSDIQEDQPTDTSTAAMTRRAFIRRMGSSATATGRWAARSAWTSRRTSRASTGRP